MTFEKLEAPSMTDLFVKAIEEKILTGELSRGDRLPTERTLAANMGISLAVVHNGLKKLEKLGFVRIAPRKGTFVEDFVRCGGIDTLTEIMNYVGKENDMKIVRQFGELRKVLELQFFEDACDNRTEADLIRLKEIMDNYMASSNIKERSILYFDFIHEMAVAGGSVVSPMLIMSFRNLYLSFYPTQAQYESLDAMNEQLKSLYVPVEKQDKEGTRKAVVSGIEDWLETFSSHFSSNGQNADV